MLIWVGRGIVRWGFRHVSIPDPSELNWSADLSVGSELYCDECKADGGLE